MKREGFALTFPRREGYRLEGGAVVQDAPGSRVLQTGIRRGAKVILASWVTEDGRVLRYFLWPADEPGGMPGDDGFTRRYHGPRGSWSGITTIAHGRRRVRTVRTLPTGDVVVGLGPDMDPKAP